MARNLKRFIAKYQEDDRRADVRKRMLERLNKRKQLEAFRELVAQREAAWRAGAEARRAAHIIELDDNPEAVAGEWVEETYEVVLSQTVETMGDE